MIRKLIYKLIYFLFGIDISRLMKDYESAKVEIEDLSRQLEEYKKSNTSLLHKIEEAKNILQLKENELEDKLIQIQSLDSLNKLQNESANKLSNDIDNLNQELNKSNKEKDILKEKLETFAKENSNIEETIQSFKEIISQQQSQIAYAKDNDKQIEQLKQTITDDNKQIVDLKNEVNQLQTKIKEVETDHSKSVSKTDYQMADGVVVVHKGLNVGKRINKEFETEENEFEYIGEFNFDIESDTRPDTVEFPDVFFPKKSTKILNWHEVKSTNTVGVSEPVLTGALEVIRKSVPQIQILQNTALSIRNRDYSYRPDIAIFWPEYNLLMDIEIDEPYDLVLRKPLHYRGSSDYLRNLYFISQGWVVVRLCEEQVIKNTLGCVKYIADILSQITGTQIHLNSLDKNSNTSLYKITRWTYDEAKELEAQKYRENYLGIEMAEAAMGNYQVLVPFESIPPNGDILPEVDYPHIESKLNAFTKKYIRLTLSVYETQCLLENHKLEVQNYLKGISGFNLVEEISVFIPLEKIKKIEELDSPYKYPLYNRRDNNDERFADLMNEAIYNFNPIRIEYVDGNSKITFRNIALMDYLGHSQEYFCDNIWKEYYSTKDVMIEAYCLLREAQRQFYIYRMNAIQIFDVKHVGIGHLFSFSTALRYPLEHNDFKLCKHIVDLAPEQIQNSDLYFKCNFAHYLLLSGNPDQAIQIYKQHKGLRINAQLTWEQMNLQDFKELSSINEEYKSKFDQAKHTLKW